MFSNLTLLVTKFCLQGLETVGKSLPLAEKFKGKHRSGAVNSDPEFVGWQPAAALPHPLFYLLSLFIRMIPP
jgi:hypothetical protein